MIAMMTWYRDPAGANKTKGTGTWNASFDYDRRVYQYWRDTLNCAYPTASAAYTAATGGYPVGDLNWFPARRHAWETDPLAGVAEPIEGTPSTFALYQNYPNPFNPATRISFNLEKAGYATVVDYNMLGQKVASPVSGNYSAGVHEVTFDASQLSTGVYFYRLESGSFVAVRKMMVLR
jgi:hypothetical protein